MYRLLPWWPPLVRRFWAEMRCCDSRMSNARKTARRLIPALCAIVATDEKAVRGRSA